MKSTEPVSNLLPSVIDPVSSYSYKTHKCEHCGLGFKTVANLRHHILAGSSSQFSCSECNEVFFSRKGMKQHFGKVHSKVRKSRCGVCKKRFRNKYALRLHFKQVHEESTRVRCLECNSEFYNAFSMRRHFENTHKLNN
jgi:hypothetical protein